MKKIFLPMIVMGSLAAGAGVQAADSKALIKHRQGVMNAISGHLTSIFSTLRGPESFAPNRQFHADSIANLAKISVHTFPEGTDSGKTSASSDIWSKPEAFKQAMDKFVTKADDLAATAGNGDVKALASAAKALGGTCKGCHDDFKED